LIYFVLYLIVRKPNDEDKVKETKEKVYSAMIEQSPLAAILKQIYIE
jgi:hypothetical protein